MQQRDVELPPGALSLGCNDASCTQHSAVLASLGAGVLALDSQGVVTYANDYARGLFSQLDPVGVGLRRLLGLVGATNGHALAKAAERGAAGGTVRLALQDGRVFDGQCKPWGHHGCTILLSDMSFHIHASKIQAPDRPAGPASGTGLHAHVASMLDRAEHQGESVAVLCIALDRFKPMNDILGDAMGDAVLTKVTERLSSAVRPADLIVRLGGDKFAIIQTEVGQPEAAEALARRLVDLLGRTFLVEGHVIDIGASIGIAISPQDGREPALLLKNADRALFQAKAGGRTTFLLFHPSMDEQTQARRQLELQLCRALGLKQFELAYQPQIDLQSGLLVGFEALLRWRHPERGSISPAEFIPMAEEIGFMGQLGAWVLRTACRQAASWPRPVSIAVNVSPTQFRDDRLVTTVKSALAASGLAPERLELEITEGVLLDSTDAVLCVLHELKSLGIRISMDDFGTGYSSLSYLQKFPFDKIKIDQSFVRGSDANPDCSAIVRAISALASSLGMQTTAEGVETPEQLARVRLQGCDQVQGYLTGRPLPAAETEKLFVLQPHIVMSKEPEHEQTTA